MEELPASLVAATRGSGSTTPRSNYTVPLTGDLDLPAAVRACEMCAAETRVINVEGGAAQSHKVSGAVVFTGSANLVITSTATAGAMVDCSSNTMRTGFLHVLSNTSDATVENIHFMGAQAAGRPGGALSFVWFLVMSVHVRSNAPALTKIVFIFTWSEVIRSA